MWGVYRFKEGLWRPGDPPYWSLGPATQAISYRLYTQILPRLLERMRQQKKQRTRRLVG